MNFLFLNLKKSRFINYFALIASVFVWSIAVFPAKLAAQDVDCRLGVQPKFTMVTTSARRLNNPRIVAAADLDGDGQEDLLVTEPPMRGKTANDRLKKVPLQVFLGLGDGTFRYAPDLIEGGVKARRPVVIIDDFNGDMSPDLVVFDAGQYVLEDARGYGNPPQLFLSESDGRLWPSDAISLALKDYQEKSDLHIKSAVAGDIDGDGDLDIWVESSGGDNLESHFILNNNDSPVSFTVDEYRIFGHDLTNRDQGELWRYDGAVLVDLDNDRDLDLVVGQIRDQHFTHINQSSIVLKNDGVGGFRRATVLPLPQFHQGFTAVPNLIHYDVNGDKLEDLLMIHERNDETNLQGEPFTGRYVQVLVNQGNFVFVDETDAWMGDQTATSMPNIVNGGSPKFHDVDENDCADLIISGSYVPPSDAAPLVYLRIDSTFQADTLELPHNLHGSFAMDANGDGEIDFVTVQRGKVVALLKN